MIEFDSSKEIIKPEYLLSPVDNCPSVALLCFDDRVYSELIEKYATDIRFYLPSSNRTHPVYGFMTAAGKSALFTKISVGAPVTAGAIEELSFLGVKDFILFGSGGSLNKEVTSGNYIIPSAAFRDEGTSYHYAPASDYIDIPTWKTTEKLFRKFGIPCAVGKTWTTDAFYRETENKYKKRKEEGCVIVEMECAAAAAVCKFRNKNFYSFLWTADTLCSDERWKRTDKSKVNNTFYADTAKLAVNIAGMIYEL